MALYWCSHPPTGQTFSRISSGTAGYTEQGGALSLVGIVEAWLSLVETFMELKYFYDVAPPALLCHKEPAGVATS